MGDVHNGSKKCIISYYYIWVNENDGGLLHWNDGY